MSVMSYPHIVYPLTALVTVNFRAQMLSKQVILPFIILVQPVLIAVIWRVLNSVGGGFPGGSQIADPYFMYSEVTASMLSQIIVPLIALLRGTAVLSGEIEAGTLIFLRLRPVPRVVIAAGKLISYWLSVTTLLCVTLFVSFMVFGTSSGSDMFPMDLDTLFRDIWVYAFALAAYGAVMMALGIVFKNAFLFGIMILLWDAFGAYIPGSAHRFTIKHYVQSLLPQSQTEGSFISLISGNPPASTGSVILVLLGVTAVAILISAIAMNQKELKGNQQES